MVVTGTLIILTTSLFLNGGAGFDLVNTNEKNLPNAIVMNTVIASATSGLTLMITNQFWNTFQNENLISQTGMVQNYNL